VCRYAPDQRTVADMEGRINNFIDVSGFKPFNEDSSTLDIARKEDEVGAASRKHLVDSGYDSTSQSSPACRSLIWLA
jgi:5'-AMP-activated protein kinase regulatory beta subunit